MSLHGLALVLACCLAQDDPAPPAAAAARPRLPQPGPGPVAEAEKQVRILFKAEYAKKSPVDQQALAQRLLTQGLAMDASEPETVFVLLREARDISLQVPDFSLAMKAVDGLADLFEIEPIGMKAGLLTKAKAPRAPEAVADYAKEMLAVLDQGLASGDVEYLADLVGRTETAVRAVNQPLLLQRATGLIKDVQAALKSFNAVRAQRKTLETNPEDPAANLAVGRVRCFDLGDWARGLPLLAKGGDGPLKTLAMSEAAGAADSAGWSALADGWWDAGEREKNPEHQKRIRSHAAEIYEKTLPALLGLTRARAEKRIQQSGRLFVLANTRLKSPVVGGSGGGDFDDPAPNGAILIGLRLWITDIVKAAQPIYLLGAKVVEGRVYGRPVGPAIDVLAKPGYAVGGLLARGAARVDSVKIMFLRISGPGLEARDKYESPLHGGSGGGQEVRLGGDGAFVIGFHGRCADDLDCLGIVQAGR